MKWMAALCLVTVIGGCQATVPHPHTHEESLKPPPGSNQMLRAPITISDDLEVIISDVVIPPGATVPRHYHPGEEFLYVIEGSAVHVEAGKPDQVLSAGDAYVIPPEAEHAPRGGPDGARAIVFRVHKQGLPERVNIGDEGPIPDTSDLTLRVEPGEISALQTDIQSLPGAHCHAMASPRVMCHAANGREVYVFSEPGSMAHPSALFRGFAVNAEGVPELQERGWSAADPDQAQQFFAAVYAWPDTGGDHQD
ncbi:MAG: cupin domain-containing protein [Pseudomonadota bacterium]